MAVLTKSSISTSSSITTITHPVAVVSELTPALVHSANLLSTTALFLILRTSILSQILLKQSFYASQVLVLQTFLASRLVFSHSYAILRKGCRAMWKRSEPFRDRCFFEFMVWILNPNALALLIFWPGWVLLGGVYGVWSLCGYP